MWFCFALDKQKQKNNPLHARCKRGILYDRQKKFFEKGSNPLG